MRINGTMLWCISCLVILSCFGRSLQDTNLLVNGDFEAADTAPWTCPGCTLTLSRDSHSGKHSVSVTARHTSYAAATQFVKVKAGQRYYYQSYVKLLNQLPGHLYHEFDITANCRNSQGHNHYNAVGNSPYVRLATGWKLIGGDFQVPSGYESCKVYIKPDSTQVTYLLDDAILAELPQWSNFRSDADKSIENLRKADVNIQFVGSNIPKTGLSYQLIQTYSEFIFGSAIDAKMIVDPKYTKYQQYFYDNFEWGVPSNSLKWPATEHHEGQVDFSVPMKAVDALIAHGKKVKGHNIFWDVTKTVPKWLQDQSASEVKPLMVKRIKDVVGDFKGKLLHWDVNNENLHGDFYEEKLKDPNITMWMFQETHKADPHCKLFLNDYNVVSNKLSTFALLDQAQLFKASGVPVYGVGIQSHVYPPVDVSAYKFRLDQVAKAGLPIMITELDIDTKDEDLKAKSYEDLYRLYFSHPAVMGIMQWHFWRARTWRPDAVLTDGPDLTPNKAGKIVRQLVWEDWRTNHTEALTDSHHSKVRVFKGDYLLRVMHQGQITHEEKLTVDKNGLNVTVSLKGTGVNSVLSSALIG